MIANKSNTKRLSTGKRIWQENLSRSLATFSCVSLLMLVGCSGGSGGGDDGGGSVSPTTSSSVEGYAVKGPLKNATASLYAIDLSAANLKGALLDTGVTNDSGSITNLDVPALRQGPYLLEVTGGKELDDSTPVIPTLRTIVRADQLADDTKATIVATPLTTLVTEMARASAQRKNTAVSGTVTLNNFFTTDGGGEVGAQTTVIKSSLGLGLLSGINIFTTPPLITGDNDVTTALRYRTAIEVNAALFAQILAAVGSSDADAVLAAYAQDLSDGAIDGMAGNESISVLNGHVTQINNILSQSPSALMALTVPGVTPARTVAQLNEVVAEQAGIESLPPAITITTSTIVGVDSDGDGRIDSLDRFLNNASEQDDADNDCATARGYTDPDYLTTTAGNGCGDRSDYAPNDPAVQNACQAAGGSNDPDQPTANAGAAITRMFTKVNYDTVGGRTINLSGENSCDPNGDDLTYQWTVVSVPMAGSIELLGRDSNNNAITKANMLSGSTTATPSFTANFAGDYVLSLVVSDGTNVSEPDTVTVSIDKGYYVDIDGRFMFLSSLAALLLLAVPAKLRKKNITS